MNTKYMNKIILYIKLVENCEDVGISVIVLASCVCVLSFYSCASITILPPRALIIEQRELFMSENHSLEGCLCVLRVVCDI